MQAKTVDFFFAYPQRKLIHIFAFITLQLAITFKTALITMVDGRVLNSKLSEFVRISLVQVTKRAARERAQHTEMDFISV